MPHKNSYQKQAHEYFEARFSGTEKGNVRAITRRNDAFYRLNAGEFARKLVDLYNAQLPKDQKLTPEEIFTINDISKVFRIEVLPRTPGTYTPFFVATKNRAHLLNEVEIGSYSTPEGKRIREKIERDLGVMEEELERMATNDQLMPRNLVSERHPCRFNNPTLEATHNALYLASLYQPGTELSIAADKILRAPKAGITRAQIIAEGLRSPDMINGVEQELVDCFHESTGYLPMNGQLKRKNWASTHRVILDTQIDNFPSITMLSDAIPGFVGFEFHEGNKKAEELVRKVYRLTRAATDSLRH